MEGWVVRNALAATVEIPVRVGFEYNWLSQVISIGQIIPKLISTGLFPDIPSLRFRQRSSALESTVGITDNFDWGALICFANSRVKYMLVVFALIGDGVEDLFD